MTGRPAEAISLHEETLAARERVLARTARQAWNELRLHLYSAGQCHESRRHLSAGGFAGWNGYHAELD